MAKATMCKWLKDHLLAVSCPEANSASFPHALTFYGMDKTGLNRAHNCYTYGQPKAAGKMWFNQA